MSVSFADSLKKKEILKTNPASQSSILENVQEIVYQDTNTITEIWEAITDKGYEFYTEYHDDSFSTVDEKKNVKLDNGQINLTQESNSQYIPFKMPRYYDGYDLSLAKIQFHYVNSKNQDGYDYPCDVYRSNNYIKFAWLVDGTATMVSGILRFEIQAFGENSLGETYLWSTKPNNELNVLESLRGNKLIEPDDTWKEDFIARIDSRVVDAQNAANEAKSVVASVERAAADAKSSADEARSIADELSNGIKEEVSSQVGTSVDEKVAAALLNYYNKEEVESLISGADISDKLTDVQAQIDDVRSQVASMDGLADFNVEYDGTKMTFFNGDVVMKEIPITSNPSEDWVTAYTSTVDRKIADSNAVLKNDLVEHQQKTDADFHDIHDTIDKIPSVIEDEYYKKVIADERFATKTSLDDVNASVNSNKSELSALSETVAELSSDVASIDRTPRYTYDLTYEDNQMTLWEIQNEGSGESENRFNKSNFTITGGSGSAVGAVMKIGYITKSPLIASANDVIKVQFSFDGRDSSGDILANVTGTWLVNGTVVGTSEIQNGDQNFSPDLTQFIPIGTQTIVLRAADLDGNVISKIWKVQRIDVRLETSFVDTRVYPIGSVEFRYTPYGGTIDKTVHFILDGNELPSEIVSTSGITRSYTIPSQAHGSHLLEVYMTADISGNQVQSNHIFKDIMFSDPGNSDPIIGCAQSNIAMAQYDTVNISYVVYDPATETPMVTLCVDGKEASTHQLNTPQNIWQYRASDSGTHTLTITCKGISKTITINVEELEIDVSPVTDGLVFDFNPVGGSNNAADRIWSYGDISMSVSDNFDWVNGGYQIDKDGDRYFCVKAGTSVDFNYALFGDEAKLNGKEFKLIFKTTNVSNSSANFLNCLEVAGSSSVGIEMNVHEANIYAGSSSNPLYLPYSENDIIEFEFNINPDSDDIPSVMGYEDGVASRAMIYSQTANFVQNNPKTITLGSPNCDLHIYRLKVYNTALTDRGILKNFIADARTSNEMLDRFNRNQIYDENEQLSPEVLADRCPELRIIKIDAPWFTNDKKNKVTGTTIQCIYAGKNKEYNKLFNWTAYDCQHSGQGTSSNSYGYSGRNLDLIMNKSGVDGKKPRIVLGDGTTEVEKVALTETSVENNYFNIKVNIASSENANNALLQRRYNQYNPYVRTAKKNNPFVKDTMEFVNCVVFIRENDPDISTHREFGDTNWHFYAIGNLGDSKKTDASRVDNPDDPMEAILEILDYNLPLSEFPKFDEDGVVEKLLEDETFAGYAPDPKDTDPNKRLTADTYEWRYVSDKITPEIQTELNNKWKEFYRFIVTSTDEEFKAHLGDYAVVESMIYYYLFTERYTMVDNRAKNSFWHYGKCDDGIYRWDLCFNYDDDTSLGINNVGSLVIPYGVEDVDLDEKNAYYYRAANSTFFTRLRDLFKSEMQTVFKDCDDEMAWSSSNLISQFDTHQAQFPEELWRKDIERKYVRTYTGKSLDNSISKSKEDDDVEIKATRYLTEMMNGRKKYQRRQFERNQDMYFSTKYFGSTATEDFIMLRFNNPVAPVVPSDFTLYITPYSNMYVSVLFGNVSPLSIRAKAGELVKVEYPLGDKGDITNIYGASHIQAIDDLSRGYIGDNDFSRASRLQRLVLGSDVAGYENNFLEQVTFGSNRLLEYLDIRNTPALVNDLDLTSCANLKELYADGSAFSGIVFANGGLIHTAELPAVGSVIMKNLSNLNILDVESWDNLYEARIENCNLVDVLEIVNLAPNLNRVRIIGVDWDVDNADILERLYNLKGFDKDDHAINRAVLSGNVHVTEIRQEALSRYNDAWPDLAITYDSLIEQVIATFVNDDGSILATQYVDKGSAAVNPGITPIKESSVEYDFTFSGWDPNSFSLLWDNTTYTAQYAKSKREYEIKYVLGRTSGDNPRQFANQTLWTGRGKFGDNVPYPNGIPTYTATEGSGNYYLFNRWDKSGFIDGEKTVTAIFDHMQYTGEEYYTGKELKDLSAVEIYAMKKIPHPSEPGKMLSEKLLNKMDAMSVVTGNDVVYDDIEQEVIVDTPVTFTGSNHLDTGLKLFDIDRDFVLAVDFEFFDGNTDGAVIAQCCEGNSNVNGFRLDYSAGGRLLWGNSNTNVSAQNDREIIVIRHVKGNNNLTVYSSNLSGDNIAISELTRSTSTITASDNTTLVFGATKTSYGVFEKYAKGNVNWCKIWYKDLGDTVCKELAAWIHEPLELEVFGFRQYALESDPLKVSAFSMISKNILERAYQWHDSSGNSVVSWKNAKLNSMLNTRLYNALPVQMRLLMQKVCVPSFIDGTTSEVETPGAYITLPSLVEVSDAYNRTPHVNEGNTISYFATDGQLPIRTYADGQAGSYWLRSINMGGEMVNGSLNNATPRWVWSVSADGSCNGYNARTSVHGIVITLSF